MMILQRNLQAISSKIAGSFIVRNSQLDHRRICLAYKYGRASKHCKQMFTPHGGSPYHQLCCRSCYQKLHRLPGFIRQVIRQED